MSWIYLTDNAHISIMNRRRTTKPKRKATAKKSKAPRNKNRRKPAPMDAPPAGWE
jgi:hypothetical protein